MVDLVIDFVSGMMGSIYGLIVVLEEVSEWLAWVWRQLALALGVLVDLG